jgi:hypothetical protein
MPAWIDTALQWPLSVNVSIIVTLSVAVPWVAVRLARRLAPQPTQEGSDELVGFTYGVYGLIYGVLLAFVIVITWERFAETEKLVMHETALLSELWRDSLVARPFIREDVQKNLVAYATSVVEDEWPSMAAEGRAHPRTEQIYENLWAITYHFAPQTKLQEAYMAEYLARMNDLSAARRMRLLHSRMEVSGVLWLALVIGAVPAVAYPLLFSCRQQWIQVVVVGSVMMIVMLGLLVTLSLQHPFSGTVSIEPEAFRQLLQSFDTRMHVPPAAGAG